MGNILKANRYRLVDNSAFEMPLPLSFSVMNKESVIADYTVSEDEKITVNIVTKFKEEMLTSVRREITISDIYYLFSCRSFQDKTPFTLFELSLLGLKKYNVYDIIRKTHGITPFDAYWIRFDGESCSYDEALSDFNAITEAVLPPPAPQIPAAAEAPAGSFADIGEILNQHKVDVSGIPRAESVKEEPPFADNKMSQDEIESLLMTAGLSEPEPAPSTSGGMMSQEDIEKLLAANSAQPEPEPAPSTSGGMMSQEDIEKLLAANSAQPEPEPAPSTSGGMMSQEDIEKLLAANSAQPEPEPAPSTSGGMMSQEDIEKLLNSMSEEAAK
ncbi:MAG: hypothetical protein ACI4XA_01150 [Oscillospiraceae bacterium]